MARPPVIPVVLLGVGGYLAWFGVHYFDSSTKWPTDPVKAVLQGKALPVPSGQTPAAAVAQDIEAQAVQTAVTGPGAAGAAPAVSGAYTTSTLGALWTSQGGSSGTAFEAANVAMAESSGNPDAIGSNPDGGQDVGLWQLDTKGVGAGYTTAQLQDPATNARITIMATANGTNWSEWADAVVSNGVYTGPKV
jgi:hypothetical protein